MPRRSWKSLFEWSTPRVQEAAEPEQRGWLDPAVLVGPADSIQRYREVWRTCQEVRRDLW